MRLKMSENSLFAYLLRSPWWISLVIAVTIILVARLILPDEYTAYAMSFSIPFVIICGIVAWQQRHVPSAARVASTQETIAAMSWRDFSALMEQAFRRDGYTVTRMNGAVDFKLVKAGRTSLVSCKRWKAASHGLEPLRELKAMQQTQEAHAAIYVAVGGMSDNARRFAVEQKISLMQGPELTCLLQLPRRAAKVTA
jgi:restriction system protein